MYNDMRIYNCMIVHKYCFIVYFNSLHRLQVPPKVTGVSVSKAVKDGQPSLRVTWTALQIVANSSKYHVEYGKTREFSWGAQVITHATTILLSKLLPGTEYNVRVKAVSAAGEGEWSEVHTETTFDSELNHLHVYLCYHVIFCNITVASNVVFSVSLPVCY